MGKEDITRRSRAAARRDLRTVRAVVSIRGRDWGLTFGPGSVIDLNERHGGHPLRTYMREDCLDPVEGTPSSPRHQDQATNPAETETKE